MTMRGCDYGKMCDDDEGKVRDDEEGVAMHQTLVMPLKNGTQKDLKLGPDFRRDDEEGKVRDEGTKNNNKKKIS